MSWGYILVAAYEYNDVFWALNIKPTLVWVHNVEGYTPFNNAALVENQRTVRAGVSFDYQSKVSFELAATWWPGTFHLDPFAGDRVRLKITAQNYQEYADKLSDGQKQMFQTYLDCYMNVYPTRRSVVYAPYIYEAALKNQDRAELAPAPDKGMGVVGYKGTRKAWAFPVPQNGDEAWMNQATRPVNPWGILGKHPGDYRFRRLRDQRAQCTAASKVC